jgi:hypothetical protein
VSGCVVARGRPRCLNIVFRNVYVNLLISRDLIGLEGHFHLFCVSECMKIMHLLQSV